MATQLMYAGAVGGTIQLPDTGTVVVPTGGFVTIQNSDVLVALRMGMQLVTTQTEWAFYGNGAANTGPRAASAGRIVSSTSVANGTLSIANQPDYPRQGDMVLFVGTTNITAGNLALTYTANDGTTQVDNMSLVGTASTNVTTRTSKAIVHLTSAIVTALAGGAAGGIQLNDTNSLGMMVGTNFTNFQVMKENLNSADETVGTVATTAASITPSGVVATSNMFGFAYQYTSAA